MKTPRILPLLATAVLLMAPAFTHAQRPFDSADLPVVNQSVPAPDAAVSRRAPGQPGQDPYRNQQPYDDRSYRDQQPPYGNDRPYNGRYDNQPDYGPGRGNGRYDGRGGFDYDRARTEFQIDRLDAMVGLSRFQAKQLRRLDDIYDREFARAPRRADVFQRLQQQKAQDVLSILTPLQRDRLFANQYYRQYQGGSYSRNYGNGTGWGDRRW
jgi:hypothetical protein